MHTHMRAHTHTDVHTHTYTRIQVYLLHRLNPNQTLLASESHTRIRLAVADFILIGDCKLEGKGGVVCDS